MVRVVLISEPLEQVLSDFRGAGVRLDVDFHVFSESLLTSLYTAVNGAPQARGHCQLHARLRAQHAHLEAFVFHTK